MLVISRFLAAAAVVISLPGAALAQLSRLEATPHLEQIGFGPHGEYLPSDGLEYCVPTSFTMAMYWLRANGMVRVAPKLSPENALSTDLAIAGLFNTSPNGGTGSTHRATLPAPETYLALKGIAGVKVKSIGKPGLAGIQQAVTGRNIGVINIGWVKVSTLERVNGHDVTVVATDINAQGQPAPGYIAIHNPMVPYTQFIPTVKLENMMNPALNGYLAFSGDILSNSSKVLAVIENITILEPDSFSQPIVPFRPSRNVQLAVTGGSMSVWAPITGPKGIVKSGASEVVLERTSRSTYRGRTQILDGRLVSRIPNGPAVGRGNIQIHGGSLVIAPQGSGVARPILGAGPRTFSFRGGTLEIRQGKHSRITAEIAGKFLRGTAGTLLVAPSRGLDALGVGEALVVNGGLSPELGDFHGIVAPYILGEQSDAAGSGDFLQYDGERGFVRANLATAGEGIRASASNVTVAAGQRLNLHALRLDGAAVRGDGTLWLSSGGSMGSAALILNGSAIDTGRLQLEAEENVVYASRQDSRISARIEGRGGLVVIGPGRLHLTGANAYAGSTTINGSTLIVENTDGSATGDGNVRLSPDATLAGTGRIGGNLHAEGTVEPGLRGGVLTVAGNAFFVNESELAWELTDLTDAKADAGARWTLLDVRGDLVFDGQNNQFETLKLKFPAGKGPDSGQSFWRQPHQWVIARAAGILDATGIAIASPRYNAGQFSIKAGEHAVQLVYTPATVH